MTDPLMPDIAQWAAVPAAMYHIYDETGDGAWVMPDPYSSISLAWYESPEEEAGQYEAWSFDGEWQESDLTLPAGADWRNSLRCRPEHLTAPSIAREE